MCTALATRAERFFLGHNWFVRSPKHSFAAIGAARRGHSRGFQRSSLCLIVLTLHCAPAWSPGAQRAQARWQPFSSMAATHRPVDPTCRQAGKRTTFFFQPRARVHERRDAPPEVQTRHRGRRVAKRSRPRSGRQLVACARCALLCPFASDRTRACHPSLSASATHCPVCYTRSPHVAASPLGLCGAFSLRRTADGTGATRDLGLVTGRCGSWLGL